jgi:hypothetical protein
LPQGHGNDGLLQDLRRLLDEARDLEDEFDEVIRPPPRSPPANFINNAQFTPQFAPFTAPMVQKRKGHHAQPLKRPKARKRSKQFASVTPLPRPVR